MTHHDEYSQAIDAAFHFNDELRERIDDILYRDQLGAELIFGLSRCFYYQACLSEEADAALVTSRPGPHPCEERRDAFDQNVRISWVLGLSITVTRFFAAEDGSPNAIARAVEFELLAERAAERLRTEPTSSAVRRSAPVRRAWEAHGALIPELYERTARHHVVELKLSSRPVPRLVHPVVHDHR